jgi:hypothetical protein
MYEKYLATPFAFRVAFELLDPVQLARVYERLGQLYEQKREVPKAIANYQAFVDLWKDADPELQRRVVDARRQLQKLRP